MGGLGEEPFMTMAKSGKENANIEQVENGFILRVGCKTFVAKTLDEIFEGLKLYYADEAAAKEKYCRKEESK